ncbi:MAG: hypothetical protein MZV63_55325 [Marinilabiliales bacterium]|nr:hypothetical protein [Marinilabiliales bacterium]
MFFINNRIENIREVQDYDKPNLSRMLKLQLFMAGWRVRRWKTSCLILSRGDYDVLLATTIIESGLDIPNANTIFINDAHTFGLSELHQLRGRVGEIRTRKHSVISLLRHSQP